MGIIIISIYVCYVMCLLKYLSVYEHTEQLWLINCRPIIFSLSVLNIFNIFNSYLKYVIIHSLLHFLFCLMFFYSSIFYLVLCGIWLAVCCSQCMFNFS